MLLPVSDLYYTDLAQHLIMAGEDIDDLDRDLSDLSDRICPTCEAFHLCCLNFSDASTAIAGRG